jgi:hypothetical protein
MLPPREKMTICFAHVAYRFADRFALRGTGIDFFEVRNRDDLDARIAGADVLVCSGLWRNDLPKLSPGLQCQCRQRTCHCVDAGHSAPRA